jgi:hypothetical protein
MSADSRVVAIVPATTQAVATVTAALTVEAILHRRQVIKSAIDGAMEEGVHFGIIPGTGKRLSLLKEGAEMLLSMFQVAVEPIVTDLSTPTEVRFRVECRGSVNGNYVGSGVGICSSNEEKYRWRKPRTSAEYDDMLARDPNSVKIKYSMSDGRECKDKVVRQSPYDAIQTILSMAEKRAKVDLCKGALAASECLVGKKSNKWGNGNAAREQRKDPPKDPGFNQQTSPAKTEAARTAAGPAPTAQAKAATPPAEPAGPILIGEDEVEKIGRILDNTGIPDSAFLAAFEIGRLQELEASRFEAALAWLERNSP